MKTFKLFSIVLLIHLFAVPLVVIQLGSQSKDEVAPNSIPGRALETAEAAKPLPTKNSLVEMEPEEIAQLARDTSPVLREPTTHIVRSGESPSVIAKRYGMQTKELMSLNGITDPSKLQVGAKLTVYAAITN
jgi:LysM repeat protein